VIRQTREGRKPERILFTITTPADNEVVSTMQPTYDAAAHNGVRIQAGSSSRSAGPLIKPR
jgi:hypothetical protein